MTKTAERKELKKVLPSEKLRRLLEREGMNLSVYSRVVLSNLMLDLDALETKALKASAPSDAIMDDSEVNLYLLGLDHAIEDSKSDNDKTFYKNLKTLIIDLRNEAVPSDADALQRLKAKFERRALAFRKLAKNEVDGKVKGSGIQEAKGHLIMAHTLEKVIAEIDAEITASKRGDKA